MTFYCPLSCIEALDSRIDSPPIVVRVEEYSTVQSNIKSRHP